MKAAWISLAVLGACGGGGKTYTTSIGTNEAGVRVYNITETGDHLTIVGVDDHDKPVGHLDLQVGSFVMSDEFSEGRTDAVEGRQLAIETLGQTITHESAGLHQLRLPQLVNPNQGFLNAFMTDDRIEPVLARWGVTFDRAPAGETPYTAGGGCYVSIPGACTSASACNVCSGGGYSSFVSGDTGNSVYRTILYECCSSGNLNMKTCGYNAYDDTWCGQAGGKGCAACWQQATNSCATASTTDTTQCSTSIDTNYYSCPGFNGETCYGYN